MLCPKIESKTCSFRAGRLKKIIFNLNGDRGKVYKSEALKYRKVG